MENPEEILHSLEEFSKLRPKDIPRELEDYLCFVAKTGDPVYQWSTIKSLFREKLINVITEFYESCPSIDIPPCPNVDMFNYEAMKTFILEKLDTFAAAPFTVQRICELLTTPRKEYNRIDKYMRALEKNILVVSTTEPGNNRRSIDNPEGIVNGLENDHLPETSNSSNDINVEEMDDSPSWPRTTLSESSSEVTISTQQITQVMSQESFVSDSRASSDGACSSSADTVITCRNTEEPYVFIEPVPSNTCRQEPVESDVSVTITPIPADVQKRRDSLEPVVSSENTEQSEPSEKATIPESSTNEAEQAEQVTEVKPEEHEPSEADETADSTSQPQAADEQQQEKQHLPEVTTEDAEISNSVESTSTEASSEEVKEAEVDSEISAEAAPEESEAEKAVPIVETSAVSPPAVEDVSEIPKHESESEENSKDSEVSSSSSSVTSNDEDSEEASKPSSEAVVADLSSEEKEVSVEEEQKDSNEAENKDPEAMQIDESGDARTSKEDEEEVAESKAEETQMDVEVADTEKPAESTEGTSSE